MAERCGSRVARDWRGYGAVVEIAAGVTPGHPPLPAMIARSALMSATS